MEKILDIYFQTMPAYTVDRREMNGNEYLVVPVVMMVEGVHNGSSGPVLHTAEEIGKIPESWNGIPVTVNHPHDGQKYVPANTPEMLEQYQVGSIFNAHMDGDSIKAEAWLVEERLQQISPEALQKVNDGEVMEVSAGVISEMKDEQGEFKNEQYIAVAVNFRPDHLALLPEQIGACSIEDGCGLRVNKKGGKNVKDVLKNLNKTGYVVTFVSNETGMSELLDKMWGKIDAMDTDIRTYYLEEMFDNYVIYRVRNLSTDEVTMYRQDYMINTEGQIELTGEPQQVKREVEYITVNEQGEIINNVNKGGQNMADECKPCIKEKVDALIANEAVHWIEDDRKFLEGLEEGQLDKMIPIVVNVEHEEGEAETKVTTEQAIEVLKETWKTPEDFMKVVPEGIQEQMRYGQQLYADKKKEMVQSILANTDGVWTEDELNKETFEKLEKIASSVEKVDYTANSSNTRSEKTEFEPMPLPGVKFED
jgi:hypothetical protein